MLFKKCQCCLHDYFNPENLSIYTITGTISWSRSSFSSRTASASLLSNLLRRIWKQQTLSLAPTLSLHVQTTTKRFKMLLLTTELWIFIAVFMNWCRLNRYQCPDRLFRVAVADYQKL